MVMAWDIQNEELRFIAMIDVYHAQKQRAFSTSLLSRYSNLTLLAKQTGVVGAVVAAVQQTELPHTAQPRQYVITKNIADIRMSRLRHRMSPWYLNCYLKVVPQKHFLGN